MQRITMINYKPLVETLKKSDIQFDEMARLMNSSVGKFKAKINNGLYISLEELDKMCGILHCTPNDIIEWEEGEQKSEVKRYRINWELLLDIAKNKGFSLTSLSLKSKLSSSALFQARKRNAPVNEINVISIARALQIPVSKFAEEI